MKHLMLVGSGLACVLAPSAVEVACAQQLATELVASGLTRPIRPTSPRGDDNRLFYIEQRFRVLTSDPWSGRIRILNLANNTVSATPYLSISNVAGATNNSEQGLLGLTFHPDFLNNGYFFVNYTRSTDNVTVIARYRANTPYATSATANPASATILMTFSQPQTNHNGGWIDFGADGMLYIATGDGGSGNDSGTGHTPNTGNAQDPQNLLGKILRIDVDGADNIPGNADDADATLGLPYRIPAGNAFNGTNGRREIFHYGLRNPWGTSIDSQTGDLWIADVGQDAREEINVQRAPLVSGLNYGWRCQEGFRCTGLTGCVCNAATLTLPIADYDHTNNIAPFNITGCSVTGGVVYRGCAIPWLRGTYFFADYCGGQIISFRYGTSITNLVNRTIELDPPGAASINNITSFSTDNKGEIYITDASGGEIFRIIAAVPTPNCNASNCGTSDFDGDGDSGTDGDIEAFFRCLSGVCCPTCFGADFDNDGDTGTDADIEAFFRVLAGGAC